MGGQGSGRRVDPIKALMPVAVTPVRNEVYLPNVAHIKEEAVVRDDTDIAGGGGVSAHDILSTSHTDASGADVVRGDLIIGDVNTKWARLPAGAVTEVLTSDGTDVAWAAPGAGADNLGNHIATQTISGAAISMTGHISGATYSGDGSGLDIPINTIENPDGSKNFNMTTNTIGWTWNNPQGHAMDFHATGAYSGALIHLHQHTGNPGAAYLMEIESDDTDIEHIKSIGPATTTEVLCTYVTGDGEERFILRSDGNHEWGDGTKTSSDTILKRASSGSLATTANFSAEGSVSGSSLFSGSTAVSVEGHTHAGIATNTSNITALSGQHANLSGAFDNMSGAVDTIQTHVDGDGSDHADVATNTTHTGGDGSDHADVATNTAHAGDSSDPHGATLTQTNIVLSSGARTGDWESTSAAYLANILYGTGGVPPTASGFTRGSIYLQYTA